MFDYFSKDIEELEQELFSMRKKSDISEDDFTKYEDNLNSTVENPDEVWEDLNKTKHGNFAVFIKYFRKHKSIT